MEKEKILQLIEDSQSGENLQKIIDVLRVICANRKTSELLSVLNSAMEKSKIINDKVGLIKLYELKIKQLYLFQENLITVNKLVSEMYEISEEINYKNGLALVFQIKGYIEFVNGNRKNSLEEVRKARILISESDEKDIYVQSICDYSFAVSKWLVERDINSAEILQRCVGYFYSKGFYHSLVMSLGTLVIIYQQTQNKEESMKLVRRILSSDNLLLEMPKEIQAIVHFFIGFSHGLSLNLNEAEKHLLETQIILKPIYKKSIYSGYYLTSLSHLTAIYALQGRLELALDQMEEVEELIEEGIASKNLDSFNRKQIAHTFNLTKFYINSRLSNFTIETEQELVQIIINNLEKYHSNAIMLSEFLLNANLTKEQLTKIRVLDNPSTIRVEHIINFLVEKTIHTEEQQIVKYTTILQRRPVEERMTYGENTLADLLAAREYYKIKRFAEIYPLLKKYEKQLHRIEVLEMRIFMEAFIQVGKFKSGDPLGPALQYMAIKKCRLQGFSRLENKLLNYLEMQRKDIQSLLL
ncbi:MAG: hypothetical protein HGN29_10570 [Asgard group archaeon]|nr:hypothetical protein [Asgard group archaeon]